MPGLSPELYWLEQLENAHRFDSLANHLSVLERGLPPGSYLVVVEVTGPRVSGKKYYRLRIAEGNTPPGILQRSCLGLWGSGDLSHWRPPSE